MLEAATLVASGGLEGDHHRGRQVTLLQAEHLPAIASLLGRAEPIPPEWLRRNLLIEGLNLAACKDSKGRLRIGEALLEYRGGCPPCDRMEQALGPGGWRAMLGHGGICMAVLEGGQIAVGDAVELLPAPPPASERQAELDLA